MKIRKNFKIILYSSLAAVFFSGLITLIMDLFFRIQADFGSEPRPEQIWLLHFHSIVSLGFLMVFGYLIHSHILPSLRAKSKLKSGLALLLPLIVVILTVPGLFYLTDENLRKSTAFVHSYLGASLFILFFIHFLSRVQKQIRLRTRRILRSRNNN